tara:strand:- start:337 stop:558 length:222 start_codon:yes stop_codon:yes gene_type:complete
MDTIPFNSSRRFLAKTLPSNIFATGNHLSFLINFPDSNIDEPIKPKKINQENVNQMPVRQISGVLLVSILCVD